MIDPSDRNDSPCEVVRVLVNHHALDALVDLQETVANSGLEQLCGEWQRLWPFSWVPMARLH